MSKATPAPRSDAHADCAGCALTGAADRRAFLRDALLGLGALALPWRELVALSATGSTRRYPIPAADGVEIDKEAEVILARHQNVVYAFSLACPHQKVAVRWEADAGRFQCPKHKSRYRPDGEFISGRATRGLDRFAITRDGNAVVVDTATMYKQDEQAAGWNAALVRVG